MIAPGIALALALGPSVTPDLLVAVEAESTAGVIPTDPTTSTEIATLSLTPAIGGLLTAQSWYARLDYRPRMYLRFPRDIDRPLILNQLNASLRTSLGAEVELLANGYVNVGEIDYSRASLLAEQITGQAGTLLPPGLTLTNAFGTTLALTTLLEGDRRLLTNASFSFTELLSTAEGMTGDNNPFPRQLRFTGDLTYVDPLSARDELSARARFGWTDIGASMLAATEASFRTIDVFGAVAHRFDSRLRGSLLAGVSVLADTPDVLPNVGVSMTYDRSLSPSWRTGVTFGVGMAGFVNPAVSTYDPRVTASLGASVASRDVSIALNAVGYTIATFAPRFREENQLTFDSGLAISTPVSWHVTDALTVGASFRVSWLAPDLRDPAFEARQGDLIGTVSVEYSASTVDTPTARANAGG